MLPDRGSPSKWRNHAKSELLLLFFGMNSLLTSELQKILMFKKTVKTIDIHGISQTSYTAPCNGVVSHGAQIGGLRVFADHIRKNKRNTNASVIFTRRAVFYACLSSRSGRSRCRWHMHRTNHGWFDYGGNPKTPNLSPMPKSRWRRFWDLRCISLVKTHLRPKKY